MLIEGFGESLSEKERPWCEFLPLAVIIRASEPADVAVICHVADVVPAARVPMLSVGADTVKWPLCEVNVSETLERDVYLAVFTLFSTTTVTVDD